jgi:hypothetical protein
MRSVHAVLSLVVVLAVWLGVLAGLRSERPVGAEPRRIETWRVLPGSAVSFAIPQRTGRFLLWTAAERDDRIATDLLLEHRYAVTARWLDGAGNVVREDPLWLASPIVVERPFPPRPVEASPLLVPVTASLSLPPELAERVRRVEITVPDGLHAVRVRLYQSVEAAFDGPEARLARLDERAARLLALRLDLPWDDITREEAIELADVRWRSLSPIAATLPPGSAAKTQLPPAHVPVSVRRALGEPMRPGQSVAWTLPGPIDAVVVYDGQPGAWTAEGVVEDLGPVAVTLSAATPPAWWPGAGAVHVRTAVAGETTVRLTLGGDAAVPRMLWLVAPEAARRVDDRARAVPMSALLAEPFDEPRVVIAPQRVELRLPRVREGWDVAYALPEAPVSTRMRLTWRPLAPVDGVPILEGSWTIDTPAGPVVGSAALPFRPAAFERARPGARFVEGFDGDEVVVGEPVQIELDVPAGAREIRVTANPVADAPGVSRDAAAESLGALISVSVPGAAHAGTPLRDATGITRLRYAPNAPSSWIPLTHLPEDAGMEGEEAWRFVGNTRRELMPAPEPEVSPIFESAPPPSPKVSRPTAPRPPPLGRLHSVATPDDSPTEGWMLSPEPGAVLRGVGWCRLTPGGAELEGPWTPAAAEALDGVLWVRAWAPGARAGVPVLEGGVDVRLDGVAWSAAPFRTGVVSLRERRAPASRWDVQAPTGTEVWVRTVLDAAPCGDPWLSRTLVPVGPGRVVRWALPQGAGGRRVVIAGVASSTLVVDLKAGGDTSRKSLPVTSRPALSVETPASGARVLDGAVWRLPEGATELVLTVSQGKGAVQVLLEEAP